MAKESYKTMTQDNPVYAIGDIHGRSDLLKVVIDHAASDAARRGRDPRFVFLGDIVDRGHDSKGCLDLVARVLTDFPGSRLHLGNHDQWFLQGIDGQGGDIEHRDWLLQGGYETLESYGAQGLVDGRPLLRERHADHLVMLRSASIVVEDGPFTFVHAGIDPTLPVKEQDMNTCLWIRSPFLEYGGHIGRPVVHGHTIMVPSVPFVTENRISMDTGAYRTGRLSVITIDPVERTLEFHQTNGAKQPVEKVTPMRIDRGHGTILDDVASLFDGSRIKFDPERSAFR